MGAVTVRITELHSLSFILIFSRRKGHPSVEILLEMKVTYHQQTVHLGSCKLQQEIIHGLDRIANQELQQWLSQRASNLNSVNK